MKKIEFRIDGTPVAKGRPRFAKVGQFMKAYTPKETLKWEELIYLQALQYKPPKPFTEPCELDLLFYLLRPKSLPKKVQYHAKKPDLDNLCKSVSDALEGIFFRNDSQIFRLSMEKFYTTSTPGIDISLRFPTLP